MQFGLNLIRAMAPANSSLVYRRSPKICGGRPKHRETSEWNHAHAGKLNEICARARPCATPWHSRGDGRPKMHLERSVATCQRTTLGLRTRACTQCTREVGQSGSRFLRCGETRWNNRCSDESRWGPRTLRGSVLADSCNEACTCRSARARRTRADSWVSWRAFNAGRMELRHGLPWCLGVSDVRRPTYGPAFCREPC